MSSPLAHGSADWKAAHEQLKLSETIWQSLGFSHLQSDLKGGLIENRQCPCCQSTIGRPISHQRAMELLLELEIQLARSREQLVLLRGNLKEGT